MILKYLIADEGDKDDRSWSYLLIKPPWCNLCVLLYFKVYLKSRLYFNFALVPIMSYGDVTV